MSSKYVFKKGFSKKDENGDEIEGLYKFRKKRERDEDFLDFSCVVKLWGGRIGRSVHVEGMLPDVEIEDVDLMLKDRVFENNY